ncbi:MAG: stage II sporulation protein M [Nanoarchaeota archaeon]|nr:stage II sporulation protein M [Nanoarchaeota archaeon]
MVLESLVNPLKAEAHPSVLLFNGFLYATLGLFLGYWIFAEHASLIHVFLTTMAAIPLIYNIVKMEEHKDLEDMSEKSLLVEHSRAISVFMYYFLGATLAYSLWFVILPNKMITELFNVQIGTLLDLRGGNATGQVSQSFGVFSMILSNNLKVLIFCILFSFIYGIGAIFILTWNASVIGVAIGDFIRTEIYKVAGEMNFMVAANYFQVISIGLLKYSIHGIPEIVAYFIAGLAGGIISVAAIRHDFGTKSFEKIVMDSAVLVSLSLLILVLAAVLEVWVTPIFF